MLAFPLPAQTADPMLRRPAPVFTRADLDQHPIDLSAYRGRVVLLTFWATWCAPCRVEMPRFAAWHDRYGPAGLDVIAVSMDDDPALVRALLRKHPVNYPVVMGDAQLATLYGGILGLPATFLIDRQGNIAAHYKGETRLAVVEREMLRLLRTP